MPKKLCPLKGKKICKGERCAIWVTSSGMCAIKDISHTLKKMAHTLAQPIQLTIEEEE